MNELRVTTESGRVYLVRDHEFMRCGEGEAGGQWFRNNEWVGYSFVWLLEVGQCAIFWKTGVFVDPDLWMRTSRIVKIERSEDE